VATVAKTPGGRSRHPRVDGAVLVLDTEHHDAGERRIDGDSVGDQAAGANYLADAFMSNAYLTGRQEAD
jgi:hypothetical protein